jgi:DNA-binding CsgD family transcriptional regulator/PAS domain-containing protein
VAAKPQERMLCEAIGSIYDAALDCRTWPVALNRVADLLEATSAQLGSYDSATHRLEMVTPRIAPEYAKSFIEYWASRNTVWQRSSAVPLGQVMWPEMFLARNEWQRTDFFNEWYHPQRFDSLIGSNVVAEGSVSTVISSCRKEPFTSAEIDRFRLIIPHVQRAMQMQLRLAELEDHQAGSAEILDRLQQGVFLVDENGTVHFANQTAERMLAQGTGLHVKEKRLHVGASQETAALQAAIASCVETARSGVGKPTRRIRVSRADEGSPLSVLVIPLRPQAPWSRLYRPAAILFVSDPECRAEIPRESLRSEFGMTPAEAALALEILTGRGLQEASRRLHITLSTARTHLAHIFRKTNTRSQAQLVRLILQSNAAIDR